MFGNQTQSAEALCHAVLPLRLLPLVRHLQQLRHLRRRLVVRREYVIHVLFEAVVVELSPLLDFAGHLLLDFFDVRGGAVGAFEGFPGIQESDALEDVSRKFGGQGNGLERKARCVGNIPLL